ncbi:DUF4974 domain-containing protein [Chitinophaga lutea]|uniref:DUF4974 domain-containing protein n=1 Tax=Chitinophaga lutea TaxID=2488634 RepID=A0A3N4Q2U6_9BACT|nr:FecR family protein [Chitinophaga lutea]RPE13519.1 DUF4974 domain-containing protein [Chitinophaga lutea]
MRKEEFIALSAKISDGSATEQEIALYNAYYDELMKNNHPDAAAYPDDRVLLDRIHASIDERKGKVRPMGRWIKVAAAVVLVASLGGWLLSNRQTAKQPAVQAVKVQDAPPGGNKAYLTLADGSKIAVDDASQGQLATQGKIKVSKSATGELIYEADTTASPDATLSYNTLTTPRGGQFRLLLPDGSRVWLNAESSLRFPTSFAGHERLVELTGEGYFEVAKNAKQPFVVATAAQRVTVLGTHFNVQAYGDQSHTSTTLLEGSVQVSGKAGRSLLAPGEQCRLNGQTGSMQKLQVDTEEAVAWKNGYFIFNETYLVDVLRQLGRWYNVEADFAHLPAIRYNGTIPRNVPLSKAIEMLEITGNLRFETDGKTIRIKK